MTELPNDISLAGLNFTRAQEGRALRAYQDSVGVWTVGYGLTNFDKNLPWRVGKGLTITEQQAEWHLLKSIRNNYLSAARRALSGGTYTCPQGALDGAIDFHFNTGGVERATWPKALARGDMAAAKDSLMSWNKAGGRVLSGLTRRRAGNWLEISAEDYGHLRGPDITEPGADNQERQTGRVGELLAALPTDPGDTAVNAGVDGDTSAGNVDVDGIPQATTVAPGVLMLGSSGPAVAEAQNLLTTAGYPTIATGEYDQATYDSVYAFQQSHPNLTADGKIGPATRETLKRAVDMRGTAGTIVKTALPTIPAAFIALHNWVSAHAGMIALTTGLAIFVTISGFYLWRHRHDATGWVNSLIGRAVP